MGVDLLGFVLVERDETIEDVIASSSVIGTTFSNIRLLMLTAEGSILVQLAFIIREIVLHGRHRELLFKSVDFVEEEDDGGFDEPS